MPSEHDKRQDVIEDQAKDGKYMVAAEYFTTIDLIDKLEQEFRQAKSEHRKTINKLKKRAAALFNDWKSGCIHVPLPANPGDSPDSQA